MAGSASASGAEAFLALSKRLKAAGQKELRKELNKAMQSAAKPLIPKVKDAAQANLPSSGGINALYAKKPYRAQVRTGAKTAGVRITGNKLDPRVDQEGRVAHPVFGRPGSTVVQNIPGAKGYFSDTLAGEGDAVRRELLHTLIAFTDRIAHGS